MPLLQTIPTDCLRDTIQSLITGVVNFEFTRYLKAQGPFSKKSAESDLQYMFRFIIEAHKTTGDASYLVRGQSNSLVFKYQVEETSSQSVLQLQSKLNNLIALLFTANQPLFFVIDKNELRMTEHDLTRLCNRLRDLRNAMDEPTDTAKALVENVLLAKLTRRMRRLDEKYRDSVESRYQHLSTTVSTGRFLEIGAISVKFSLTRGRGLATYSAVAFSSHRENIGTVTTRVNTNKDRVSMLQALVKLAVQHESRLQHSQGYRQWP